MINSTGVTGESNVIRISDPLTSGSYPASTCYIGGIYGVNIGTGSAILVNATSGQLGTIVSSRRYKENIQDISDSQKIQKLRPVSFTYKSDKSESVQYGLIAEEVEAVYPELVQYNSLGEPETVSYHLLPALLMKEIQRLNDRIDQLERKAKT